MSGLLDFSALSNTVLNGLNVRQNTFTDTVSRMSSGLRIQSAADGVAPYQVSVQLDNRNRGWNVASQNIQNGISFLQTADGGLSTLQDIMQRIRELSIQSANGVYGTSDRQAIQDEMSALRTSFYRITDTTQFNGQQLLTGTTTQPPTLVDTTALATPASGSGYTAQTQTGSYAVDITQTAKRGEVLGNQPATPLPVGDPPTVLTISTPKGTATAVITYLDPPANWPAIISAATASIGVTAQVTDNTTQLDDGTFPDPLNEGYLLLRTTDLGSPALISVSSNKFVDSTGFTSTPLSSLGADMQGMLNGVPFNAKGLTIAAGPGAGNAAGLSVTFGAQPPLGPNGNVNVTVPPAVISALQHVVQYAPDHLDEHLITIPSLYLGATAQTGPNTLGTMDISTQAGAQAALDVVDQAIQQINDARAQVGAHLSALQGELTLASNGAFNTNAAGSRITDADMAAEATALAQSQIQQQASESVLQAIHAQSAASLDFMVQMLRDNPLAATSGQ